MKMKPIDHNIEGQSRVVVVFSPPKKSVDRKLYFKLRVD